ncbi:MoxR family ATPase [Candidatus Woesearchaeota archaeon]|nr:MoxR family ATPase [Candidatus Woesearchaeota archaeon]
MALFNSSKQDTGDTGISKEEIKALEGKIKEYHKLIKDAKEEIGKIVIGQESVIDSVFRAIFANGHLLFEGVPGIAKTLMVRTVSQTMGCSFARIQFTPDLLPSDITGLTSYQKEKGFYIIKGPVFANFILADEINRAPPKVQSALLECMQEKQVTIGHETLQLPVPFFVMATQNPLEQVGTYPLPEAQVDRFLFKLMVGYPTKEDEIEILNKNMTIHKFEHFDVKPIFSPDVIVAMQDATKLAYLSPKIEKYLVTIIDATRYPDKYKLKQAHYIEWGASPRGSIGLFIAAKSNAILRGRTFVIPEDVKEVAYDVLRHRLLLSYEAQAESVTTEQIITEILQKIPVP